LRDIRSQIQDIHLGRKTRQTEVGERLQLLESQWVGLVSKNYEIERACVELEKEIPASEEEETKTWPSQSVDDEMDMTVNREEDQEGDEGDSEPKAKKARGPE